MVELCGKKFPLLKVLKCLLTVIRGLLLILFLCVGPYCVPLPTISLITVFIYSFRMALGFLISVFIFVLFLLACCCSGLGKKKGEKKNVFWALNIW